MAVEVEVRIPDIGDFDDVEIVEVLVSAGDQVEAEDSLVTLESDKATMEIPAPRAGRVLDMKLAVGDRVSEGSLVLVLSVDAVESKESAESDEPKESKATDSQPELVSQWVSQLDAGSTLEVEAGPSARGADAKPAQPPASQTRANSAGQAAPLAPPLPEAAPSQDRNPHASPLVRGFARELGVDLRSTAGSGPSGRILLDDVRSHVRSQLSGSAGGAASLDKGIPAVPAVDFSQFGSVEDVALPKIRRVAATHLHRSWLNVPHVTQHDEADITELELFRKSRSAEAKERGLRLSPLLFLLKAVVISLRRFPDFRSSLAPDGQALIRKNYFHIGIAVDTENGLVVPVVRDVDQKSIYQLAGEVAEVAEKARARKLRISDMQGGVFTISSLGGIGGTAFTPIVNAPEVAVLGVSRTATRPVWVDEQTGFVPRQLLPLSLSYDHRVIDGASAARFTTDLCRTLSDPVHLLA